MPRSKNTNSFSLGFNTGAKHPKTSLKQPKANGLFELRGIQQEISDRLSDKSRRRILAATGSGKSIAMMWLAVGDGARGLTPVITFPQHNIKLGFVDARTIKHPVTGESRRWDPTSPEGCGPASKRLVEMIRAGGTQPILVTAATWVRAVKRLTDDELSRLSLFVDEGHHVNSTDNNRLHDSVMRVCAQKTSRVTLATATWMRDDSEILSDSELNTFADGTYRLELRRYLQEIAHIEKIYFRYILTEPEAALTVALKEDRPMMIFERGGQKKRDKLKANRKIVQVCEAHDRTVVDLVDDTHGAATVNDRLREFKLDEQHPLGTKSTDVVAALYRGNEGFDWPRCSQAFFVKPKNAMNNMIQAIGRTLRYFPGKKTAQIDICVPPATDQDQLKGYLQAVLGTAVLGTLVQGKIRTTKTPAETTLDELREDVDFVFEAVPELAEMRARGASDDAIRRELAKYAETFEELQDPEVFESVLEKLTETVDETRFSRGRDGSLQLNTAGVDQIWCPIELAVAVAHGIETCSGAETQDVLAQIRMQAFVSAEEVREYVQKNQDTMNTYRAKSRAGKLPEGFPGDPRKVYDKPWSWLSGYDMYGEKIAPEVVRDYVQKHGLTQRTYSEKSKAGKLPEGFPGNLSATYGKPWSWFTGNAMHDEKVSPETVRTFVQGRQMTRETYQQTSKNKQLPPGFPSSPESHYGKPWSWFSGNDFLNQKFVAPEVVREYVQKNQDTMNTYRAKSRAGKLPEGFPSNPIRQYSKPWSWFTGDDRRKST